MGLGVCCLVNDRERVEGGDGLVGCSEIGGGERGDSSWGYRGA